MGLPTVVFVNPVNREIKGNMGIYATAGDVKSLAQALLGILQDRSRARQLGAQGRAKAKSDYSWLAVGKRLKHIYDAIEKSSVSKQDGGPKEKNNEGIEDPGDRRSRFHGLQFNKRAQ
jgi:hypothetical protein